MTQQLGLACPEAIQLNPTDRQRGFALIKAQGTTRVRFEIPWVYVERSQGVYDWKTYADPLMSDASAAGMTALVVIAHPPSWANPAGLGKFMTALLARYSWIPAIEVYNEMNLSGFGPNPKVYAPLLVAAYKAIKDAKPSCTVVLGGLAACVSASGWFIPRFPWFSPWTNYSPLPYLQAVHAAGGAKAYDVLGYHPYSLDSGFVPQPPSKTQLFMAMIPDLAKYAARPIWCTEFGFSVANSTLALQASYLATGLDIISANPTVERTYVHSLRDISGEQLGLYDVAKNQERPAMAIFRSRV